MFTYDDDKPRARKADRPDQHDLAAMPVLNRHDLRLPLEQARLRQELRKLVAVELAAQPLFDKSQFRTPASEVIAQAKVKLDTAHILDLKKRTHMFLQKQARTDHQPDLSSALRALDYPTKYELVVSVSAVDWA